MKTIKIIAMALTLLTAAPALAEELVDYVNPMIGTDGIKTISLYGGMIPGVTRPFGMIQWTPMTAINRIGVMPYRYSDHSILGFIGTRQPTHWMGDYGHVSIMPGVGEVRHGFQERKKRFNRKDEISKPHYYKVTAGGVTTELTGATRCAIFRIRFSDSGEPYLVIDASRKEKHTGMVTVKDPMRSVGMVRVEPDKRRVIGFNTDRHSGPLGPPLLNFKGWFVIEFDRAVVSHGAYNGDDLLADESEAEGDAVGAYVTFSSDATPLLVRIGTSLISLEQAEENLRNEIPDWDFDKVADETKSAWNEQLGKIVVEGGDRDMKTVFYTGMYHAHLYPRVFSEGGRYYSAFDDQVHEGVAYNDYSLWDTFRALHPLLLITAPERVGDMVTSLTQSYEEGGWLPKWPNPTYTGIMIGSHADSMIADAYVKGVRDFDLDRAYAAVRKNAFVAPDGDKEKRWKDRDPWTSVESRGGQSWYMELGYVPADKTDESVSRTLEFAYNDFCVAQLAKAAGQEEDYKILMERAKNYKNLYHNGFMRARNADGEWAMGGFTEALKWHYMFMAIQDVPGLIDLYGGPEAFSAKLDKIFAPGLSLARYLHSNEPVHHYTYLYDYSGQPWKTQREVRRWAKSQYHNRPTGYTGNDDCGQMSAWHIFTTIGFYPVTPGTELYAIGSPHWDKVVINLDAPSNKTTFTITAKNQGPKNYYIQSATLNGEPLNTPFLKHSQIVGGGELQFVMSPKPNKLWGTDAVY
jgi:predicted alpha-1,2-mannosidase